MVVLNNADYMHQTVYITKHPFNEGDKLCNAFALWDCVRVEENRIKVNIIEGYPKIYIKLLEG